MSFSPHHLPVGRIYWIKWPRNEGVKVLRMTPEQAEVELKEHPEDVIQPSALFRSAMDHSRRNYSFALGEWNYSNTEVPCLAFPLASSCSMQRRPCGFVRRVFVHESLAAVMLIICPPVAGHRSAQTRSSCCTDEGCE